MVSSQTGNNAVNKTNMYDPKQAVATFQQSVIERFHITLNSRAYTYNEYLTLPESERSNDEADAVDQRFARSVLEWLGFEEPQRNYNRPQAGHKANRPDYVIHATVGTAFIWEDKNSTLDLNEEHLVQMQRYSLGTAGYAVWCNMRRILAVRFIPSDSLKYETLADITIAQLFDENNETQATNLALFRLLFGKERFTQFTQLLSNICVDERTFEQNTTSLDTSQAMQQFIDGSRQSLEHLRLAALSQVLKAVGQRNTMVEEEENLRQEWEKALSVFTNKLGYDHIRKPVTEAIQRLTSRLGEITVHELQEIRKEVEKASGTRQLSASLSTHFTKWQEQAVQISTAFLILGFQSFEYTRIADAYRIWSERQGDQKDVKPEIFAEQVAYVFFIRLLLVRILEDKHILQPRLASDGGFDDWLTYVRKHFQELDGLGILNETYYSVLARKASYYYLHFFQQAVFDWFVPDDFLLIETLEFLCRYDFQKINSDIIGFTYEEYIERNVRNRKGHFLTRSEVVDYMLDLLEYEGAQVLGRSIFDPACGSGSFLVHAAHRYREALVNSMCRQHSLSDEKALSSKPILRNELARNYLDHLTSLFFGMELNPFACYLAEMNLLIQGLDDLFVLQQAGEIYPIERFQIFNTDSLHMPGEVLDTTTLTEEQDVLWSPSLSEQLTDEASPIKAKSGKYLQGFFFIISNPPYINASQITLSKDYSSYPFYAQVLSGATNTYLLFLRLGMHYLGGGGRMIYIIPLTIIGDAAAASARRIFRQPPFRPTKVVRFFSGNVLFPGVDQAVAIIRVDKDFSVEPISDDWEVSTSGGYTIMEARQNESKQSASLVLNSTPINQDWQSAWMVSSDASSYSVWDHVKTVAKSTLGQLWGKHLEVKKGDLASDHLNPFRLGHNHQPISGDIAIQKGEDVFRYAPLARKPSDWARPKKGEIDTHRSKVVNDTLLRIQQLAVPEQGITLRKIARLNTREAFIATWFQRSKENPFVFPDEQWRFRLLPDGDISAAKAFLALLNSRAIAYLLNLFSTNNNVAQGELARLLIPNLATFPSAQLAQLADDLLAERAKLENDFVIKYGAKLPEFDDGTVYLPPSRVLATTRLPRLRIQDLVGQGAVKNTGPVNGRIRALATRNLIVSTLPATQPNYAAFAQVLALFLHEPEHENETWAQAQNWQLPDTVAAVTFLNTYNTLVQQAQVNWDRFVALQRQVDGVVADWYGFDAAMRQAIAEGLPWARRRRNGTTTLI